MKVYLKSIAFMKKLILKCFLFQIIDIEKIHKKDKFVWE